MAEMSPPKQGSPLLTRLIDLHLQDELEPKHHSALMQRLTALHAQMDPLAPVPKAAKPNRARAYSFGSLSAGLLMAAAVWALWLRSVPISPEPRQHRDGESSIAQPGTLIAQTNRIHSRPCVTARGDHTSLWEPGSGDLEAPAEDGRFGRWVHFRNDGRQGLRGPVELALLDLGGSTQQALRVEGPAAAGWGAKLSLGMRARVHGDNGVLLECYDATAYRGLRFRASGSGIVQVVLQTADSIPVEMGGGCTGKCWFSSSHAVALGTSPKDFEIPWRRFGPDDTAATVVPQLMMLDFVVQSTDVPYSLTLTNIEFMRGDD